MGPRSGRTAPCDRRSAGTPRQTPRQMRRPRPGRAEPQSSPTVSVGQKRPNRNESGRPVRRPASPLWKGSFSADVEVVRANGLAAVLRGALRRRLDQPVDVVVETVEGIARGVAAGVHDQRLHLRGDEVHLLRTAATPPDLPFFALAISILLTGL